jgi:S-adenosyl methyltransferase
VAGGTTAPLGIDTTVPTPARMYDFWLGGHDNFAVDRKFLRLAVRYLAAEAGIAQFLDIGTGLPTQGNVHQVAQQVNPDARVVYVDNDPMVLAHSCALKTGGNAAVIQADLRDPAAILTHPWTLELIDFRQPLAVLLVAVLHFIGGDDDPYAITGSLCEAMAPGSHLVVSHAAGGILSGDSAEKVADYYRKTVARGRRCATGTRSSGSSRGSSLPIRAWSRCRTGVRMNPNRWMPARSGFSAPSGVSLLRTARDRRHDRRTRATGKPGVSDDDAGHSRSA